MAYFSAIKLKVLSDHLAKKKENKKGKKKKRQQLCCYCVTVNSIGCLVVAPFKQFDLV